MTMKDYALPEWQEFVLAGELGRRLHNAVERLIQLQPRLFIEQGVIGGYGYAEIAGNWLETMELVSRYNSGGYMERVGSVADELLTHQQPYGGFCADVEMTALRIGHWVGDQRALGGLLAAWRAVGDPRFLAAAKRVAAHLMERWPQDFEALADNTWGSRKYRVEPYFYSALNFVALYEATAQPEHLAFARRICLDSPRLRPDVKMEHADGRMMNLHGLLRLCQVTGEESLLAAVVSDHRVIADHFMWPSGGMPEILPDNLRDEACQTANWARLNLALWDLTGNRDCLDLAERTWLNHLYFDQHPSGGFCWGRTLRKGGALSQRMSKTGEPFEMWYCCSETAPRALLDLGRHAVTLRAGQPAIALWAAGSYRLPGCHVEIASDLAPDAALKATCASDAPVAWSLRLPAHAEMASMVVNGDVISPTGSDGWLTLPPLRHANIQIDVRYREWREEHLYPKCVIQGGDANNADTVWDSTAAVNYVGAHTAMFIGPWLLKADVDEAEWFEINRRLWKMK